MESCCSAAVSAPAPWFAYVVLAVGGAGLVAARPAIRTWAERSALRVAPFSARSVRRFGVVMSWSWMVLGALWFVIGVAGLVVKAAGPF